MKTVKANAVRLGLTTVLLVLAETSFSQGFVLSNTGINGGARAPVYSPDPANPFLQLWGNASDATPPGAQVYAGLRLPPDTNYSVDATYSLTPVADLYALMPNASLVNRARMTLGLFPAPGFFGFGGPELTIPEAWVNQTNNGSQYYAFLQVRAWDNVGGQLPTWDEAWNAALAGSGRPVGWSKVFYQPLDFGTGPWPGLINFESFNIFNAPEPSTIWLATLGGAALFVEVRRRRRRGLAKVR